MNSKSYFKKYTLSNDTLKKFKEMKDLLRKNNLQTNPAWGICFYHEAAMFNDGEENNETSTNDQTSKPIEIATQITQSLSTQYFYSQIDKSNSNTLTLAQDSIQISDITESICESLEHKNGKFNLTHIQNLSDAEVLIVINDLRQRLTSRGVYNLCCSICAMEIEQRIKYIGVVCSNLLLQKLINLEEPSRLITSGISECVEKFPEEIQKLIFIPMLHADLKDTTAILAIVNSFGIKKRSSLLLDFLTAIRELKQWHMLILQALLISNIDEGIKDKLTKLLLGKSLAFAKDKNYGKFVLNFLKTNAPFSEKQKQILWEIVIVNDTLFKKPMENIFKNL